jgi:transcription-repair coupling factor (superfamily II helicase)
VSTLLPLEPAPERGSSRTLLPLPGDSDALAIAEACANSGRLAVVITANTAHSEALKESAAFFAGEQLPVLHFPDRETLPYDSFSPHQDITSERLLSLYQLPQRHEGILVIPITALMHRLPPPDWVLQNSLLLRSGDQLKLETLRHQLNHAGYRCVDTVFEHGEYAVRGSLVDLFPMGSSKPFRIDFFDDEIESLRSFDSDSQRSLEKMDEIRLLPAKEMPLTEQSIKHFKEQWHSRFHVDHRLERLDVGIDRLGGIGTLVGLLGHHHSDRFANETDPAGCEHRAVEHWFGKHRHHAGQRSEILG